MGKRRRSAEQIARGRSEKLTQASRYERSEAFQGYGAGSMVGILFAFLIVRFTFLQAPAATAIEERSCKHDALRTNSLRSLVRQRNFPLWQQQPA